MEALNFVMEHSTWFILGVIGVIIAYFIARYQKSKGFSFPRYFIMALIMLLGLFALVVRIFS